MNASHYVSGHDWLLPSLGAVSHGSAGAVPVTVSVVLVVGSVLAVVIAAKVVPELVCYYKIREADGVNQGVSMLAVPRGGIQQEVSDGAPGGRKKWTTRAGWYGDRL